MKICDIKPEMFLRAARVEKDVREVFDRIDEIAQKNTIRVMEAFQDHRVTEACFAGTTGMVTMTWVEMYWTRYMHRCLVQKQLMFALVL